LARIVIIDDSKLMRSVLRRMLELGGHQVEEWEPMSAMEIVEKTREAAPELLITDFQMPGANGATVTRMARKADPKLPILCLTALRDPEVLDLLKRAEVSAILGKPCTQDELLWAVEQALEKGGPKG
jgi:CheY-like chemotaxis protein